MNRMTSRAPAALGNPILLMAALLAWLVAPACVIDTRSDQFQCQMESDCDSTRTCSGGYCITRECPVECDNCLPDGTCVIQCVDPSSCAGNLTCPAGRACQVQCAGDGSCDGNVNCVGGLSCIITCSGANSCTGEVQCGAGACNVLCSGDGSCAGGIDCQSSCACDTSCGGAGACGQAPTCPTQGNCEMGGECRSSVGGCDSC